MKIVILLFLIVPVMAYSQIIEDFKSGSVASAVKAAAGDVVITEIMADPVPEVDLPPEEYVEIYNRSRNILNLENWKFTSGDQNSFFPRIEIYPGEYLILCSLSDTTLFSIVAFSV